MQEKSIQLKKYDIIFSYIDYFLNPQDKEYTLIITGWQSKKEIFYELIETSKQNFLLFDYPGIGSNAKIPSSFYTYSDIILELAVSNLIKNYNINKVIGTSAGSAFILKNIHLFKGKQLFILSPVLSSTFNDFFLSVIFKLIFILQKIFKIELYSKIVNISAIKNFWAKTVGEKSKREKTLEFIKIGMENSHSVWTPAQFFQLLKNKKIARKRLIQAIETEQITFIIGENDKLADRKEISTKLEKLHRSDLLKTIDSNHVIELESIPKLIEIIYS